MRDYFISYASENRAAASELVAALELLTGSCFVDHRDIPAGHPRYRDRLIEGINDCECIVVLLSPHAQASDEVYREVQAAHDRGRRRIGVWLGARESYTNGTLEMLLGSSQDIVWGPADDAHAVAQKIRANATVSTLRTQLRQYQSVVDRLQIDLSEVFARLDLHDRTGAVAQVQQISIAILRQLWVLYGIAGAPPDDLRELIGGCRDRFEHAAMIGSFAAIEDTARRANLREVSMDATTKVIEHLMTVLSLLRTQRWGLHELSARLRADAAFLSGLLIEAGWLQGSELVPSADVVYMVFERPLRDSKRYLEVVLGDSAEAMAQISAQSDGRIFPPSDAPVVTRFLVIADGHQAGDTSSAPAFLTPDEFVMRFTGLRDPAAPAVPSGSAGSLAHNVLRHLSGGRGNVLVYGAPGSGKTHALRALASAGWPGAPRIRFFVDYAAADQSEVDLTLDTQLAQAFPPEVRHRTRELVSYLVRTGRAALILDSIDVATRLASSTAVARTFARLCTFLSEDSTVVMAGRDAALRDSPTVREFFLHTPAVSDVLSHTLRSTGVDLARLPRLAMVRARPRRPSAVRVATPRDGLIDAVGTSIWDSDERRAAEQLALAVPIARLRAEAERSRLSRAQIQSMAVGMTPSVPASEIADCALERLNEQRGLRELRAAVDYVCAATTGADHDRWTDITVGETTRRLVRLLSRQLTVPQPPAHPRLALVGPPNSVVVVETTSPVALAERTVTAAEFREFLAALPALKSLDGLSPSLPDESLLLPMYERIPKNFYRDDSFAQYPATGISWWAADSYARWAGTRLPTSLEWEVAGRGWDGRIFPWGDSPDRGRINCADSSIGKEILDYSMWYRAMRSGDIAPRASRPADADIENRTPAGILDMSGNVWEWVSTSAGEHRVIAGGSYDNPIRACVVSSRSVAMPSTRSNAVGFRVVEP